MIGRVNTGGGSGGLNFQVIGGTTAPSNPKENMIWVNTSTKITSYIFSATQPTGSAGMVWISTATYSQVEFNALKKNGIQVYPLSAKQYVGGALVDVEAQIYQNGEWSSLRNFTYLFNNEVNMMTVTGCSTRDKFPSAVDGVYSLSFNDRDSGWTNSTYFRTDDKVDLSKISTLYVKFQKLTTVDYGKVAVSLTTNAYSGVESHASDARLRELGKAAVASINKMPDDNVWVVDVRSYDASMYIYIGAYSGYEPLPGSTYNNAYNGSVACEIAEVYYA